MCYARPQDVLVAGTARKLMDVSFRSHRHETIVAIDLGKRKSVVCEMPPDSLVAQYRTRPEMFHSLFAKVYCEH